jgi:hypothetical protein
MIKIKLNPLDNKFKEFEYIKGENLNELLDRVIAELKLENSTTRDFFHIYINGEEIEKDFFAHVRPKESTEIVISIVPEGSSFGETFKTVALIVVVAALTAYVPALGAGTFYSSLMIAGGTIGATMALNALIPPSENAISGPNITNDPSKESQAYSITSQSNSLSKYGVVPRVYGTHRIFPKVAANPYIQLAGNKNDQYLYAIYDFGYGPLDIKELKIGETNIGDFNDVTYRLVDPNKPAIEEGYWDEALADTFELYKGDHDSEQLAYGLNTDGTQVIGTAPGVTGEFTQELELFFNFPQGLVGYATNGDEHERTLELKVEIAEVGSNDWKAYSDPSVVYGGIGDQEIPRFVYNEADYVRFSSTNIGNNGWYMANWQAWQHYATIYGGLSTGYYHSIGWLDNRQHTVTFTQPLSIGTALTVNGRYCGTVLSQVTANIANTYRYKLSASGSRHHLFYEVTNNDSGSGDAVLGDKFYTTYKGEGKYRGNPQFPTTFATSKDILKISAKTSSAYSSSLIIKPISNNQMKFRVTRVRSYGYAAFRAVDDCTWTNISSRLDRNPINTKNRHTYLEIKIKATDQLNGTIQNLNAVATSVLDTWDGSQWVKAPTENPAWIWTDILTGSANKNALDKSKLDIDSIYEWAQYCDEVPTSYNPLDPYIQERFKTSFILDYQSTVRQILDNVSSVANATLNLLNGTYGVLIDRDKTIPAQLITNRNSWGFKSMRTYTDMPDAVSIKYIEPTMSWAVNTVLVYNDGYDLETAVKIEEFDAFGCINYEQAFRYGRFLLAQAKLRQESVSLSMDFENMVCTRGDLVYFQQDIMRMGGQPVRVTAVSGNTITINDSFTTEMGVNYGYTLRKSNGDIVTDTMTILDSDNADVDGDVPEVGDLLVWGEVDKITTKWLVKSIIPSDDLSASLSLVEYNEAIYTSESDEFLADYELELTKPIESADDAPSYVTDLTITDNDYDCDGNTYVYFIDLEWEAPVDVYDLFELYVNTGSGYDLYTTTANTNIRYTVDPTLVSSEHFFKVLAVSATGSRLTLGGALEVSAVPVGKTLPPSDVDAIYLNVTNSTVQVNWDLVDDCDINDYLVRFSPLTSDVRWDKSSPLFQVDAKTSSGFAQARTGTYLIKARDWNGNESNSAVSAITSIPELTGLNVIEEVDDFPDLLGTFDKIETLGDTLLLSVDPATTGYYSEGFYYFKEILDLGEIYTTRLQAYIVAGAFSTSDIMANWPTLTSITSLSSSTGADYQVDLEYRARDTFNSIAEWSSLSSVPSMSDGEVGDWTSWTRFTIGDFTGRIFQFRIRLRSYNVNISPQVIEAKVIADMTDRTVRFDNLICPINGLRVDYDPAFAGPTNPNIQITQDAAQDGDYYTITNRSVTGFDIEFFNGGSSVQRQFDSATLGYGRKAIATI